MKTTRWIEGENILLACGILSSILYVLMNIVAAAMYEGYSSFSQTVSELSAIGTPTRGLWVPLGIIYSLLISAFAWGILNHPSINRPLKIVGWSLMVYGIIGIFWPPMHQRETIAAGGGTFTDTMHIVFTMVTVILMMVAIGVGTAAFGVRFRVYSILTMLTLMVFGYLTARLSQDLEANLPTPWMGVWERINIGAFLLWIVVLSSLLLRQAKLSRHVLNTPKQAYRF